jgi:glycosyltransferase involved in cell wall biosynthesis
MKIALVSQEYPPESSGGIATQTCMKAKGLSDLGHQIFVITRSSDEDRHEMETNNIHVIQIPGLEYLIGDMRDIVQWITYSTRVAAELEALHKREKVELIDFPEWGAEGYIHLLNRYQWNYVPAVIQIHGPLVMFNKTMNWPDVDSEFYRVGTHMEATAVRLADAVYSSSGYSAQWVRDYYDAKRTHIPIIHTGVDTTLFSPSLTKYNGRPTIIFVGKFVRNKGVIDLVEAACGLVEAFPDLLLRLVGRGEKDVIADLISLAKKMNAPGLLHFTGYLKKEELPGELSQADIFAAPSHYEGGPGFVYLEAMACGLPVIGCAGSGINEIIAHAENGFLLTPGDVPSLQEALRKLLTDQLLRESMGMHAREFVVNNLDSRDCIKRLDRFYRSVVHSVSVTGAPTSSIK